MGRDASKIKHNGEIINSKLIAGSYLTETVYAPNIRVPAHAHPYACFCFVLKGTYTELYRGKAIDCRPSHLIFRPAGEVHSDHFGNIGARCFIVEFESGWLTRLRKGSTWWDTPAGFRSSSLAWLAIRLRKEFLHNDSFTPLTIEGLMLEMAAEVARGSTKTSKPKRPLWLNQAKEILHESFAERLTLAEIARSVGVHPVHLATVFRQHHNSSIGEYIRRLRIEFASHELTKTEAPLADIALRAGFVHQSHFCRTFKSLTGQSPAQYRLAARFS